jgi:hypothetical protein
MIATQAPFANHDVPGFDGLPGISARAELECAFAEETAIHSFMIMHDVASQNGPESAKQKIIPQDMLWLVLNFLLWPSI